MQKVRWDDVPVFLAVVRAGSLSGAATALGVNVSTAQRRLNAFEEGLGSRLFDRSPTGLKSTPAGRALLPLAERVEDDMATLLRVVAGRDAAPEGPVHLTAPETLVALLVEPLAELRARFPGIDLRVSFADRYFDLARQEADVAVRPSPTPPEDALGRRVAAVAWASYAPVGVADPAALPWASFTDALAHLAAVRWWQGAHPEPQVLLAVNSVAAMHRVIGAVACRGLLPCFIGDADPDLKRLEPLLPRASALWLLMHRDLRRTARVRAVADHLWTALRRHRELFEGEGSAGPAVSAAR